MTWSSDAETLPKDRPTSLEIVAVESASLIDARVSITIDDQ